MMIIVYFVKLDYDRERTTQVLTLTATYEGFEPNLCTEEID